MYRNAHNLQKGLVKEQKGNCASWIGLFKANYANIKAFLNLLHCQFLFVCYNLCMKVQNRSSTTQQMLEFFYVQCVLHFFLQFSGLHHLSSIVKQGPSRTTDVSFTYKTLYRYYIYASASLQGRNQSVPFHLNTLILSFLLRRLILILQAKWLYSVWKSS